MRAAKSRLLALAALAVVARAFAHESAPHASFDPWTGAGVNLGGWLFPELNYQAVAGSSSMDPAALAVGHHDPNRHGITQQNIELALGAALGRHLFLFGNYNAVIDHRDHWVAASEEHYAVIRALPLELQLKGGRFFTQLGYHNREHLHDFTFVDKPLVHGRLIGEDQATIYGGEISAPLLRGLPARWRDRLALSFGAVPDPTEEEAHEIGAGAEPLFEGEGALWQDWLATADYTLRYTPGDTQRFEIGISCAWGRNHYDRLTRVFGLHAESLWRPAGVAHADSCCAQDDAQFLRWRTEVLVRRFDAASAESGARDEFTDAGFASALSYGFPCGKVQAHLRAEYVSGVAAAGLSERWRLSPALVLRPAARLPIHFKLQYNADYSPEFGNEHSVWAQFSLTWGDCCAHEL